MTLLAHKAIFQLERATPFASPITCALSVAYNFSGTSIVEQVTPRVNASLPTLTSTGSMAVQRNFANAPLFIGARAGTSLWFNGRIYSLIGRGAQSTTDQITQTETWVNNKTRAYS